MNFENFHPLRAAHRYSRIAQDNFVEAPDKEVLTERLLGYRADPTLDAAGKPTGYNLTQTNIDWNDPNQGKADKAIAYTFAHLRNRPGYSLGAGAGALALNHFLGNPVGGAIDAATFGLTNLRSDNTMAAPMPADPNAAPQLSAEDLKRQIDYYNKRIATDQQTLIRLQQLNQQEG